MKCTKVSSIEELKKGGEFFILLSYSLLSRKVISYDKKSRRFIVLNLIDGTAQRLSEKQIRDSAFTNIGNALQKGALFREED